jgi:DNA polymerase-3 subunit epsilon
MQEKEKNSRITTFVCFDIETTGLNPQSDKIIEIGAVKVKDGKIAGRFSELINPQITLPNLIIKLTGINDEMLKTADSELNVVTRFLEFAEDYVVLGHNIKFDFSFVKIAADRAHLSFEKRAIDTLDLSRKLHQDMESRGLESMCRHYNINNNHAHRAYDDAKATAMLYVNLCNDFYDENAEMFCPKPLIYKIKKVQAITNKQKKYLIDLLKYHKIEGIQSIDTLTQSEASRWIDRIILENGRLI